MRFAVYAIGAHKTGNICTMAKGGTAAEGWTADPAGGVNIDS